MAGRFEGSNLQQWNDQAESPAAPKGMRQAARAAGGVTGGDDRFSGSKLGQWVAESGYVDNAQSWYSGANREGVENGWDTEFTRKFISGQEQAAKNGTLRDYFSSGDATGVVTWDHESSDGRHSYKFGDIYEDGRKTGNVFDTFDRDTANLMMADWLFDGRTKAEIFANSDPRASLAQAVEDKHEQNNTDIPKALSAADFQDKVDERSDSFQEGVGVDEAIAGGGGVLGAALAAGGTAALGGSAVGPVGTAVAGALGFLAGGAAAWLNRDELSDSAARAYEITAMSSRENGLAAGVFTGIQQYAGFAGQLMPFRNVTHGLTDQLSGNAGDGESQFYKVDARGERVVPKWLQVADVGATLGDSLLQFASPVGLGIYTAQMSGVIGGEVGSLALTGETFDDRSGTFDNIFTDDEGNFDPMSGMAGIGKVGIDAVQLGMVRGLAGKTNALRSQVGLDATFGTVPGVSRLGAKLTDKLPRWAGGQSDDVAARAALEAGGRKVELGGFSYVVDAGGKAVSRRATLSLLAPSEQLAALSSRVVAMRTAAVKSGALKADDFYAAARAISMGERKWTSAVTNAMGEAYEEGIQAILEPVSHNASVDGVEVFQAAAYGAAGGLGMALGTSLTQPSADDLMFAQAQVAQLMRTGGVELTREQWKGMDEVAKRGLAAMTQVETAVAQAAHRKIAADQATDQVAGVAGIAKLKDAVQAELSRNLAKATDRTDGAFVVTQIEDAGQVDDEGNLLYGSMPSDAVVASGLQTARNLTDHLRGATIQLRTLESDLEQATAQADANPEDTDAAERVVALTAQVAKARLAIEWGQKLDVEIDERLQRMYAPEASYDEIEAEAAALNELLRSAFHLQVNDWEGEALTPEDRSALARSVSMLFARDPHDQAGSYQMLLPQVSAKLTAEGSDNVLEISHAILDAIRGDYDGDKVRPLNQLVLDEHEFTSARAGLHFLGAGTSVNVGTPKYEPQILTALSESLASGNVALSSMAEAALQKIAGAVRRRYDGLGIDAEVDLVLGKFFDAARAGSKDSRATLLDGLAEYAGGPITEFARSNLSNEWLWMDQLIVSVLNEFQYAYAANKPQVDPAPNTDEVAPVRQSSEVRERKARRAATLGQTLGQFSAGDSLFRKFQKLHYSVIGSPVLSAENLQPSDLTEMALFYESLGQGLTRTELADIRGKDEITTRVYAQLRRLAMDAQRSLDDRLNGFEAISVIANLRVADIDVDEQGTVTANGNQISLAQLLLKREVARDRREKDAIFDLSPELQAKHARLLGMTRPGERGKPGRSVNAERAFVEVVGAQQLYTLLGDEANIFGPHLTVEQFIREYVSKSETDRRDLDRVLRTDGAYLGREGKHNIPFDLDEAVDGKVSAYRAVVDAVLAVGHNRITISSKGELSGELADRSDRTSTDFQDAHRAVRAALFEFAGLSPRRDELSVELVQRMLESNPDFAKQVFALVPNAAANAVFEFRDGQVFAANWVYTMFTITDAKAAEMHYWRNLLLAQWNALGGRAHLTEEEAVSGEEARKFSKLPRRMHRVMYRLAKLDDNGYKLQQFIDKMEQATSVTEFLRWVNTEPGVRGEQAPLTAWVDDPAEFDADKTQGGWTTVLPGAELREAIGNLSLGTSRLVKDLVEERAAWAADVGVLQAIRRVVRKDAGADVTLSAGDRDLYNRFAKSIDYAGELALGLGPQAMIYESVGAVRGFYPQAHTKGKNPDNVEPIGSFDALRDAFDYVTNFERVMASLTAVNLDAVGGNLAQVSADGVRTMDDQGRPVQQGKPTVEQMLDLLERPDTRPMARAMLFPQVMERGIDGQLRPQLLVGKSLKSLLEGVSHKDLFARDGKLSQDQALRYVSLVEAHARKYNGHFSVQRAVNDIVIARTSAADHVLSTAEIEAMVVKAYQDVARVLQSVGSVAADASRRPGTDPLAALMTDVREARRTIRNRQALGMKGEDEALTDAVLDQFLTERRAELQTDVDALSDQAAATQDMAERERLANRQNALLADFDRLEEKVRLLRSDDLVGQVVQMFSIPADEVEAAPKRQAIVDYIATHLSILQRASGAKETLWKLTSQLRDSSRGNQVDLTPKEWDELSRSVITVYLDDVVSAAAANVSVPPFPGEDRVDDQRYFDTTFAYLAEPFLDVSSPLVQAAKDIHNRAGRHGVVASDSEVIDVLGWSLFGEHDYGSWTSDIPRASIEANQRLDSASAAPAIAIAGNPPKRQAVISAATRRTFVVPGEELLTTATLSARDLNRPLYDEVEMQLPGAPSLSARPLAQLNNRFAKSVVVRAVGANGEEIVEDLLASSPILGRVWHGNTAVETSGYLEIHTDRIKQAVENHARVHGYDPMSVKVDISFFHPDSQPAGPEFYNNIFFEGTSFKLDADRHESLNATLWFANESISPSNQAAALDASKLGLPALQVIQTPSQDDRGADENGFHTDLAAVLRAKTRRIMETDLGNGRLDDEFYNAVYKNLKLRHFVRGTTESGETALWTAEQVIAYQQANPGQPLPLTGTELWVPTDDVLRTMLGEQGTQGVAEIFSDQLEIDLSVVPSYSGVTEAMKEMFSIGLSGESRTLDQTRVANRSRQSQLVVRGMLDATARNAYDARMRYFAELRDEVHAERALAMRNPDGGFSPRDNLARVLQRGDTMLRAENIAFDWSKAGIPFIGPRKPMDTELSKMLLHELTATLAADEYRTGWVYREGGHDQGGAPQGLISEVTLGAKRGGGMRVAPGDLVVVELDSFRGDADQAKKRIDWLADHGATVVLGSTNGQADLRAELAEYLEANSYERIAGSQHIYQPLTSVSRFVNKQARESTWTATKGVSAHSRVAILNTRNLPIQEGAAWVNADNERLSDIAVSVNLVPTDAFAGFNVPAEQVSNVSQIDKVRAHLLGLNDAEGRAHLRALARVPESDTDFDDSLDRLFDRLNTGTSLLPMPGDTFGTGDLIPLVDGRGRVLLYRHGYKAPTRDQVDAMMALTLPGKLDAANIAVYPAEREPSATVHTGTVVAFQPRAGYGLSVELNIPLQVFGDKKQLEWNGMKFVLTPKPDDRVLPDHGFFPGWGIDLISDAATAFSKESFDGLVDNHRNAFAYFGIDFLPDVTEFFFPGEGANPEMQRRTREILHTVATRTDRIPVTAAVTLLEQSSLSSSFTELLPVLGTDPTWAERIGDQTDPAARITAAMLVYLSTPGAQVDDVLSSGGFNNEDSASPEKQSRLMPQLFTQVFDDAPQGSPLRTMLNERFNDQLHNPHGDGTGYRLLQDWTFQVRNADPSKNIEGLLQFAEAHSSGDNPVKNGMSFDTEERGAVSAHSAAMAYQAIGAQTAMAYDISQARAFASGAGVQRFERDSVDGGVWRMLTAVPDKDTTFAPWRSDTPAAAARRSLARDAVVQFRQSFPTDDEFGWDDKARRDYGELARTIVHKLGLLDSQIEVVDFWIRQVLGAPHGTTEETEAASRITGREAVQAVQDILWNVEHGYLPTVGAEVPLLHVHDLQMIYRANRNNPNGWKPKEQLDPTSAPVTSWDDWTKVALGSALLTDQLFDPLYLLATDGFMHSYQNATRSMLDLPVSLDTFVDRAMHDPEVSDLQLSLEQVSLDPNTQLLADQQVILDTARASLEEMLGGRRISGGRLLAKRAPSSEVAKRREARRRWRKENDIPVPVDVTMRNFRKNGAEMVDSSTNANALTRILINLRVGTALINPALYVSMGPEQWIRGTLDRAANLLTGQSTTGTTASLQAKAGVSRYTPEQLTKLNRLYRVLGSRNDFKAMVYRDLMYLQPAMPGIGRVEKWSERYAKLGTRLQDPTWGMRGDTLARRYLEAALQTIAYTPTLNVISTDQLIAEMMTDPTYLMKNFPEVHQAASNAIAQLRSLKPTPLSLALRGIYEPMSESTNSATNFLGNVVLKMPLLFSGYAANVATTITGLQGLSDMTAMFLHGRNKGSLIGRIQAKMRGEEFSPEDDATFDMSSVIEGIDLSRSFIRGGLTHTGLFAAGLLAGGLGLSGEDDETKRRRRAAELQGAAFVYDPRRIENDFRNADAIFLDWLPFGLDSWFRVTDESAPGGARSMGQLHWMLKQFISPIIGMERFFNTGDFRQVTWGFEDAIGAFPLVNSMMFGDAVETASELASMADGEARLGGPDNLQNASQFLMTAVGTYERMLFENSFVNTFYQGWDEYDRNPFVMPLIDSEGDIQVTADGEPRESTFLEDYVDPETGQRRSGYISRSGTSARLHQLTENRASMAFVMSLFTGMGESDYWRRNMVPKIREIEKSPLTIDDAKAVVLDAFADAGGVPNLDADELSQLWKDQARAAGVYVDWGKLDEQAAAAVEQGKFGTGIPAMLSQIRDGREHLTKDGASAVFRGLAKGTLRLSDASAQGIYIPFEMRQQIQKEWMAEIVQEGVDLGLDQTKAVSRMNRIWYGPTSDPAITGLGELLWSKDISYSDTLQYNQLNTTYVMGPDGKPWATGFTRDGLFGALGLKPVKRAYVSESGAMGTDERLNSTDLANRINTGLRALQPVAEPVPTDVEIGKAIEDAIAEIKNQTFTPYPEKKSSGGGGGYSYGGRRYGGYGGGGYSSGGYPNFTNMYRLPGTRAPYGSSVPFINTSNPYIRRASIRRERVWSERGRLKQWQ